MTRWAIAALALAVAGCDVEAEAPVEALDLLVTVSNRSAPGLLGGVDVGFSPGVWMLHREPGALISVGAAASEALEQLAEDGDGSALVQALRDEDAGAAGSFGANEAGVGYGDAPIVPGASVEFAIKAMSDESLSLVSMFGQTNDIVVALDSHSLRDLDGVQLVLLDVGTEVNEAPGEGDDQPAQQAQPGAGVAEDEVIGAPRDAFEYPAVDDIVAVTIERL